MLVPAIFTAVAVVFVALVLRDVLIAEGKLDPRRNTWLRLALIFAGVAIGPGTAGSLATGARQVTPDDGMATAFPPAWIAAEVLTRPRRHTRLRTALLPR